MNLYKWKQTLLKIFLPWIYYPKVIQDVITEAINPEFGWIWEEDEIGGRLLKQAREAGIEECQSQKQNKNPK